MVDLFFNITCGVWVPIVSCINQWWKHIQIDYLFVIWASLIDPSPKNCSHYELSSNGRICNIISLWFSYVTSKGGIWAKDMG